MDDASNVRSHRCGWRETRWLNEAQKLGAQANTGAFKTVSMAVAEAEGGILPIGKLDEIYKAALREADTRFPGIKLNVMVDLSKYHNVRLDQQLAVGGKAVYVDSVIL
ncbi:hypothetical protein GB937_001305 [Aspergillus fischeri]|nr:hypothetical protein GB937_001305 [Aspergillus fischeri]